MDLNTINPLMFSLPDPNSVLLVANHPSWLDDHTYQLKHWKDLETGNHILVNGQFLHLTAEDKPDQGQNGEFILGDLNNLSDINNKFSSYPYHEPSSGWDDPTGEDLEMAIAIAAIYSGAIDYRNDELTIQHSDPQILELINRVAREKYPKTTTELDLKNHHLTIRGLEKRTYFIMAQEHDSVAWMDSKQSRETYQAQWDTYWSNLFNPEYHSDQVIQTDDYMTAILYNWSRILNQEFYYYRIKKDQVLVSRQPMNISEII